MLWGGNCHPDVVCATRLVGLLGRLRLQGELVWPSSPGQTLYVHKWLLSRGWSLRRPLVWAHHGSSDILALEAPAWSVGVLQHRIRDGRRARMLDQHGQCDRRDAYLVHEFVSSGLFNLVDLAKGEILGGWVG